MTEKLKPCPFCGGEAEIIGGTENWRPTFYDPDSGGEPIAVICNCGCGIYCNFDDYGDAIKMWNTRAEDENEQLKRDLSAQIEHGKRLAERLKATQNLLEKERKNKPVWVKRKPEVQE